MRGKKCDRYNLTLASYENPREDLKMKISVPMNVSRVDFRTP